MDDAEHSYPPAPKGQTNQIRQDRWMIFAAFGTPLNKGGYGGIKIICEVMFFLLIVGSTRVRK
jgi:hypothetical protein